MFQAKAVPLDEMVLENLHMVFQLLIAGYCFNSLSSVCPTVHSVWTSQAFADTSVCPIGYGFKGLWTDPAPMAVATGAAVEQVNVT